MHVLLFLYLLVFHFFTFWIFRENFGEPQVVNQTVTVASNDVGLTEIGLFLLFLMAVT